MLFSDCKIVEEWNNEILKLWNHRLWLHVTVVVWTFTHTRRNYSTGNKVCCWWWQLWSMHHPHSHSCVTILTFILSYLSPHSLLFGPSVVGARSENRWKACHCCRHELREPQLHITCNQVVFFSTMLQRKQQNAGGDICGRTGRSNCFVYMWTMYKKRHFTLPHFSKEEGCGSVESARRGKHRIQSLTIYAMPYMH